MRALRAAVVLVLALALPAPVLAADFETGWKAYQRAYYATAWEEWRPLAEQGDANAQYYLGVMHQNGEGVSQNYAEAAKWFRLAAEQGYAAAQAKLAVAYYLGRGVPQDYVLSHMWCNLSAAQGNKDGAKLCDANAKEMTPEQIAEAQRLAREWKPK